MKLTLEMIISFYLKNQYFWFFLFVKTIKKFINKKTKFILERYIFFWLFQVIEIFSNLYFYFHFFLFRNLGANKNISFKQEKIWIKIKNISHNKIFFCPKFKSLSDVHISINKCILLKGISLRYIYFFNFIILEKKIETMIFYSI